MRKIKLGLLTAALVLAMAIPASASERVVVKDYGDGRQDLMEVETHISPDASPEIDTAASSKLTVINPNKPDTKGPTLKDVKLTTTTAYTNKTGKNELKASVKITDDYSGFNYGYIYFKNSEDRWLSLYCSSYGAENNVYTASRTVSASDIGTYKFYEAYFYDNAGNSTVFLNSDKNCPSSLKNKKVKVVYGKTDKTVTVKSPKAATSSVKLSSKKTYQEVPITMDLKTNKGTISSAELTLTRKQGNSYSTWTHYTSDIVNGKATFNYYFYNTEWYAGKWTVDSLRVNYSDGDYVLFSAKDKNLTSGLKNIKITCSVNVKATPSTGVFATVKGIKFSTDKLTMPKNEGVNVNIEVTVSDKSKGVQYVQVTMYNKKTYKYKYFYYSDYSKPVKSGKITLSGYLDKYSASSDYALYRVYVRNSDGNVTNYVENPKQWYADDSQKNKSLTSAMKGMKLSIKNTYKK